MTNFKKYPKIYSLLDTNGDYREETEGILNWTCYIQEKIDWANLSVWLEEGEMRVGSRRQDVTEGGFRGAVEYVKSHSGINALLDTLEWDIRLYGEWLCLSWDTIIRKVSWGRWWKWNFMTIKEMYEALNTPTHWKQSWWQRYWLPSIYSLSQDKDIIFPNKIKNIIKSWKKEVFEVTTREWKKIKASKTHPFFTQYWFVPLWKIMENIDKYVLWISDLVADRTHRRLWVGARKILKAQADFKKEKWKCIKCWNTTSLELDHIDENYLNNSIDNWQVLCRDCHWIKSWLHKRTPAYKKWYSYRFDKIVSIVSKWEEETYDITMEWTENEANFVAQDFIVHNCPHTITDYNSLSYNHFYLFDIEEDWERKSPEQVEEFALSFWIKTPEMFWKYKNPSIEDVEQFVWQTMLKEDNIWGEWVVIKNPTFINKWGRWSYAKIVSNKFKESNATIFWNHQKGDTEMLLTNKYCVVWRVRKIINKIEQQQDKDISKRDIKQIIGRLQNDIIVEEAWAISKKGIVSFRRLKGLIGKRGARIAIDIIEGNEESVAFNQ